MKPYTFIEESGEMPTEKQLKKTLKARKKIEPLIDREFYELPNGNTITYIKAKTKS